MPHVQRTPYCGLWGHEHLPTMREFRNIHLTSSCSFFAWHWFCQEQTQEDSLWRFLEFFSFCVASGHLGFCYPKTSYLDFHECKFLSLHLRRAFYVLFVFFLPCTVDQKLPLDRKPGQQQALPHIIPFSLGSQVCTACYPRSEDIFSYILSSFTVFTCTVSQSSLINCIMARGGNLVVLMCISFIMSVVEVLICLNYIKKKQQATNRVT